MSSCANGGHAVSAAAAHREDARLVHDTLPKDPGVVLQLRIECHIGAQFIKGVRVGLQRVGVLGLQTV